MEQETRLRGLFARYVEHHVEHGTILELEELCQGAPELLQPLQVLVLDYHQIDQTLALPESLQVGERVDSYRVLARLGSGGMGEVFKAEDLKLGRTAAIKVLHPEATADQERLRRFEQEARSASALNHPNIITIYDIDRHQGAPYIAMEFIEGRTLADLMSEGRMPLAKTLDYAIQIILGLTRAHSQGIVHRDLKPDNVMVTQEGLVKILDFGLAKLTEHSETGGEGKSRADHPETQEGRILGTAPYMSPEQAQGQRVDHRSDIFSFGSLLYEMVTGRRPFSGDSSVQLMAAIVEQEPVQAGELVPSIPIELDRLIQRTLQKDPARRFQSTADIKVELVEIKEELESGQVVSAAQLAKPSARPKPRRWSWIAVPLVILGILVAAWAWRSRESAARADPVTIQLTSLEGRERWPALSPDGRQVAYTWDGGRAGPGQLYVKLVDVGEALQLTEGAEKVTSPAWSPKGDRIAFLRGESGWREIVEISALGGSERLLGTTRATKPGLAWSPEGDLLAVVDKASADLPDAIFLLSRETGEKWPLSHPSPEIFSNIGDREPSFAPDGRTVAFVRQRRFVGNSDIYLVPTAGGEERRLTVDDSEITDVDWSSDGRWLVLASERVGLRALWSVRRGGGEPKRLVVGEGARGLSLNREGNRLVYARYVSMTNLYRVPGPTATVPAPPERIISSSGVDLDPLYSPDGSRILFATTRAGHAEVWTCDSEGEECAFVVTGFNPSWSPDGESIVYCAGFDEGISNIFVIPSDGGIPRELTRGSEDYLPTWSRDGESIYYLSRTDRQAEIWRIPVTGGQAEQITRGGGVNALESEDGRFLFFATHGQTRQGQIWRMPREGGEKTLVVDWGPDYMNWDLWHDNVVYLDTEGPQGPAFRMVDPESGQVSHIADLGPGAAVSLGVSVSPDGRWIVYGHRDVADSDLILVENLFLD